jgi:hypothetical protein
MALGLLGIARIIPRNLLFDMILADGGWQCP